MRIIPPITLLSPYARFDHRANRINWARKETWLRDEYLSSFYIFQNTDAYFGYWHLDIHPWVALSRNHLIVHLHFVAYFSARLLYHLSIYLSTVLFNSKLPNAFFACICTFQNEVPLSAMFFQSANTLSYSSIFDICTAHFSVKTPYIFEQRILCDLHLTTYSDQWYT